MGAIDQGHGLVVFLFLDQLVDFQIGGVFSILLRLMRVPQGDVHARKPRFRGLREH